MNKKLLTVGILAGGAALAMGGKKKKKKKKSSSSIDDGFFDADGLPTDDAPAGGGSGGSTGGSSGGSTGGSSGGSSGGSTGGSSTPSGESGKFVGGGWTGWPHKDVFGSSRAFVDALREIGYQSNITRIDSSTYKAFSEMVKEFQIDFNDVMKWLETDAPQFYGQIMQVLNAPPTKRLTVDGKLGTNSVRALYWVLNFNDQTPWPDVVASAQ